MEVDVTQGYSYPFIELDRTEGEAIEALKEHSQQPIPDPDRWLDEELKRNIVLTSVDTVINWARRSSLWPAICFPACCAFELIAANASRFDLSRFGMEILRASPRQADLMITAGTLTWKMAPSVQHMARCHIGTDYPAPIVDDKLAMKAAKDRMYGLRQTHAAREEAGDVQARHGSRKSGLPQTGQRRKAASKPRAKATNTPSAQGDLFG